MVLPAYRQGTPGINSAAVGSGRTWVGSSAVQEWTVSEKGSTLPFLLFPLGEKSKCRFLLQKWNLLPEL